MKTIQYLLLLTILLITNTLQAQDSENLIVTTIKPLHSLTKSIVGDTAEVTVLVNGAATPHSYQLKPSQRKDISNADVIIFTDTDFEYFLTKLIKNSTDDTSIIELSQLTNLQFLPVREEGDWEGHHHDEHSGDDEHDDEHNSVDLHLWLNPENAKIIAQHIATIASKKFPAHAELYQKNLLNLHTQLDQLDAEIKQQLKDVKSTPYVVFHDAFQYYDTRYELNAVGSVAIEPSQALSLKRISSIKEKISTLHVQCVFNEPQFESKILQTLKKDNNVKLGTLDPLGSKFTESESQYFELMKDLANNLKGCLEG